MNNKVIFVGSNPSEKSPDLGAFHPKTQSGKRLQQWIEEAGISEAVSLNISNSKTTKNKPLTTLEAADLSYDLENRIRNHMEAGTKVVALGNTAEFALSYTDLEFLSMPHPSGRNRKLNDKVYANEQLEKLKKYVKNE